VEELGSIRILPVFLLDAHRRWQEILALVSFATTLTMRLFSAVDEQ